MKTYCAALLCLVFVTTITRAQTPLVGTGSSYSNIFSPPDQVTYDVPGGGLLSITLSNGSTTQSSGIWDLTAQGGANATVLLSLLESAAQTQLTGSALKFNLSTDNDALLSLLGVGASIHYGWEATAVFDTPGSVLGFSDLTSYHLSFDVDGNNGLLGSVTGVTPSFSVELIDGAGNPIASQGSGTLINIAGLLGTGVDTGTINLDFDVNGTVPSGPMGVRFRGDALVGSTALGVGTEFATISNVNITATPIPEPSGLFLIATLGVATVLARHRRNRFA